MKYLCPWCKFETTISPYKVCSNCQRGVPLYIEIGNFQELNVIYESQKLNKKCIRCNEITDKSYKFAGTESQQKVDTDFWLDKLKKILLSISFVEYSNKSQNPALVKKIPVCDNCKDKVNLVFVNKFERSFYFVQDK